MNKSIFLFTKKFPYGKQETYLFDELPFLIKEFKTIYIIPYDEYDYKENENRLSHETGIEIIKINSLTKTLSWQKKFVREFAILKVLCTELLFGRERKKHLIIIKSILAQLRNLYTNHLVLLDFIQTNIKDTTKIIAYNYWLHRGVIISYWLKRKSAKKVTIISRAHSLDLYHKSWNDFLKFKTPLFLPFEFFKVKNIDKIFSISTHGYNHFLSLFPKYKSKFKIARLGVFDNVSPMQNKTNNVKIIVTCSGIDKNKRMYLMPSILAKLNVDFKWIHFGWGDNKDIEQLQFEINKYNLQNKCELKGYTPHHEIIEFYKNNYVDLFCNLSTAEGIPVSLMEAASFGIPMVATNTVGNPEIVNNENGFLIEIDFNTDELSALLNSYFDNAELIQRKREAARNTFLETYNAEKNYTQFAKQLTSL